MENNIVIFSNKEFGQVRTQRALAVGVSEAKDRLIFTKNFVRKKGVFFRWRE